MSTCPRTDRLLRLLGDDLPEIDQRELVAHLDACPDCRGALDRLAARSGLWDGLALLREAPADQPTSHWSKGSEAEPHDDEEIPLGLLEPSDEPGCLGRLGAYDVLRLIGRGGMGMVFLARDRALDRLVAIKLLTPGMAATGAARRRFAREAKAAAAVVHEHVVTIHAVDTLPQGVPYLVMQYIAGKSVQELIDRGQAPELVEILRIGSQAASALAAAHAQGLIHRDIKPANILLENGVERVKITDFGLARAVDDATMTQSGVVAGTPQYMSPEQASGEAIDHRTDLFSLGSVLYALCTGQAPFRGRSSMATLKKVCEQTPLPIRAYNPEIPTWLVAIVDRLHAKDPADRFGSAAEVADLLGRCLAHVQQPASFPLPAELVPTRSRRAIAICGAIPVCLLLAGLTIFPEARAAAGQAVGYVATVLRLKTPEGTLVVETDDPGVGIKLDGSELVVTGAGVKELRLTVGQHNVQALKDGKILRDELVSISRGGRTVLSVRREVEPPQPPERPEPPPAPAARIEVPRPVDGEEWRNLQARRLNRLKAQPAPPPHGGASTEQPHEAIPTRFSPAHTLDGLGSEVRSVCFSPDGSTFAYGTREGLVGISHWGFKPGGVFRASFKAHPGGVECVAFSPDGKTLVSGGWDHHVKLWDLTPGPDFPKLIWDFAGFGDGVRSLAFDPGGSKVAAAGFDKVLIVLEAKNGQRDWTSPALDQPINGVQFSPDGQSLALALGDYSKGTPGNPVGQPGEVQLWSWPGRRQLARMGGWRRECKSVAFDSTGQFLAATSGDGTVRLYVRNRDNLTERAILDGGAWTAGVAFRPGSLLLANSNWSGEVKLWDAASRKPRGAFRAHDRNIPCIAFSPDGRFFATASTDESVKIWEFPGPNPGRIPEKVGIGMEAAKQVQRLADILRRHPPRAAPNPVPGTRLYMRDLVEGRTSMIADASEAGLPFAEVPDWSHDGTRIVFRAKPKMEGPSRIVLLDGKKVQPNLHDLGPGDCPRFSPDDQTIAFMVSPGEVPGEQEGVWLMDADGSHRRRIGGFGAPFWSPDGAQILINGIFSPTDARLLDVATGQTSRINVPGGALFSWPRWAGNGTLVACTGALQEPDSIVLLDVSRPGEAKVLRTLWSRTAGPDVHARWPLISPATGDGFFIGDDGNKRTLYALFGNADAPGHPSALEVGGRQMSSLSLSPDGRYLLFAADRLDTNVPNRAPESTTNHPAQDVHRLAEVLKSHPPSRPALPPGAGMRLYMRDLAAGRTTPIVDPMTFGVPFVEIPDWSQDGRSIVFHIQPRKSDWTQSRLVLIRNEGGRPGFLPLGAGCCPSFSPDNRTIAFLLSPGDVPGEVGVWLMDADGTNRRRVCEPGSPSWSPDGTQLLLNSWTEPTESRIFSLATRQTTPIDVPGHKIFSWPRWAGPGMLVACIGAGKGPDSIALLDAGRPSEAKVVRTLWTRSEGPDVYPRWPVVSPSSGECFFLGDEGESRTLYTFSPKAVGTGRLSALEVGGPKLSGLTLSPDGRYLLFASDLLKPDLSSRAPESIRPPIAKEVESLADVLRRNPPESPPSPGEGMRLYMRDLAAGRTSLIADPTLLGAPFTEIPDWSHDGRHIIFQIQPRKNDWTQSKLVMLEDRGGKPGFRDLGAGCCPSFSPDDQTVAFLLFNGDVPGEAQGVWLMNADGLNRRRICEPGAPFWSPDGTQILLNSWTTPTASSIYNLASRRTVRIKVPGHKIFSWPRWAGPGMLVACIGAEETPDSVVLLDVSQPSRARVVQSLWTRSEGPDVYPRWPVVSPSSGECFFLGDEGDSRTLYSLAPNLVGRGRLSALEVGGPKLSGLDLSPDGRYLLFVTDHLEPQPSRLAPESTGDNPARHAVLLAEALKANPPKPSIGPGTRMQIYMRDLFEGVTSRIVDEPAPGLPWSGTPDWSHDGTKIVFDTQTSEWTGSRLMILERGDRRPSLRDIGPGICAKFSPDDKDIAFSVNPGDSPDEAGVWVMQADGTGRRRLTTSRLAAPFWSPDGSQILINGFAEPGDCVLLDLKTGQKTPIRVADRTIFSWPRWTGLMHTLVASIGAGDEPDSIVLLDVRRPDKARIVRTLWKRSDGPDVYARWPLDSPLTGAHYFIGVNGSRRSILQISDGRGAPAAAVPVEGAGRVDRMGGLALSPDGRFLIFNADRADRATLGTRPGPLPSRLAEKAVRPVQTPTSSRVAPE